MVSDSVSVKAVYVPAESVLSGFTEQREGTAVATSTVTLPTNDNCTAAQTKTLLCM